MALTFRFAQETDTLLILQFIRELADYEHLLDQVVADEATLRDQLFEKRRAEVLFALEELGQRWASPCFSKLLHLPGPGGPVSGGPVCPAGAPGKGIWQGFLPAAGGHRRGAGLRPPGVVVPDWNTPQHRLLQVPGGRRPWRDWTVYRLTGPALQRLAEPESPVAETDEI